MGGRRSTSSRRRRSVSRSRSPSANRHRQRYVSPSHERSRSHRRRRSNSRSGEMVGRRRRRTGWDDSPSAASLTPIPTIATNFVTANKSPEQVQKELHERQVQAANIAAMMQTKASLSQMCRIYVGSLDYTLSEADLRSVFSAFGAIVNIDMPKEGTRSKGFCFVEYSNPEAAEMALTTMQGFVLKGRSIKVGRPTALGGQGGIAFGTAGMISTLPTSGATDELSAAQAGVLAAASLIASKPSTPFVESSASIANQELAIMGGPSVSPQNRIYVGSVPYTFTADDVKQIFQVFGSILNCQLIPSNERPGTHRGYGFIEYETAEQAKLSIDTMNGFEVGGKQLKVNYATALRNMSPTVGMAGISPSDPGAATGSNALPVSPANMPPEGETEFGNDIRCVAGEGEAFASSPVVLLTNMVSPDEVDTDLKEEIHQECGKYGNIADVKIHVEGNEVRIFVVFGTAKEAAEAVPSLHGRWFGGRQIIGRQYDPEAFDVMVYDL